MTQRFEQREDCYYDTETGLEWSLENYGPMTWQEAVDFCSNIGNGWRLPTFKELLTLVDYEKTEPATKLPGMVSSYYWSSTTYADGSGYAWYVYFYYGSVPSYNRSYYGYVRCVRGGPIKYEV